MRKQPETEEGKEQQRLKWREYKRRYRERLRKISRLNKEISGSSNLKNTKKKKSIESKTAEKVKKKPEPKSEIENLRLKWRVCKRKYREKQKITSNLNSNMSAMIVEEDTAVFFVEDRNKNDVFMEESDYYESDHEYEKPIIKRCFYEESKSFSVYRGNENNSNNMFNLTHIDDSEAEIIEIESEPMDFLEV